MCGLLYLYYITNLLEISFAICSPKFLIYKYDSKTKKAARLTYCLLHPEN